MLGHSGSPALILDTWTYILGLGRFGEGGLHQSRRRSDVTELRGRAVGSVTWIEMGEGEEARAGIK